MRASALARRLLKTRTTDGNGDGRHPLRPAPDSGSGSRKEDRVMKRIGMVLAAAMMVGSMTVATGCKKADDKAQSDATEQQGQATEQTSATPASKDEAKVEAKVETTEASA